MVYHKFKQIDIICLVGSAKSTDHPTKIEKSARDLFPIETNVTLKDREKDIHRGSVWLIVRFSIAFLCFNHFAMWIRMHSNQILFIKWTTEILWYSICFIKYVSINDRFTSDIIITNRYKNLLFFFSS